MWGPTSPMSQSRLAFRGHDAQDAGTKLVVIDPIMTQLASTRRYVGSGEALTDAASCFP